MTQPCQRFVQVIGILQDERDGPAVGQRPSGPRRQRGREPTQHRADAEANEPNDEQRARAKAIGEPTVAKTDRRPQSGRLLARFMNEAG